MKHVMLRVEGSTVVKVTWEGENSSVKEERINFNNRVDAWGLFVAHMLITAELVTIVPSKTAFSVEPLDLKVVVHVATLLPERTQQTIMKAVEGLKGFSDYFDRAEIRTELLH